MFASLRRWMGMTEVPDSIPIEFTIAALDAAKIDRACSAPATDRRGP